MAETGKGDKGRGAKSRQGATSEADAVVSVPKAFETLLLRKLDALKALSRNMSFADVDTRYSAFAITVLTADDAHPIAKAAAAALLDCCCPGWRSEVEPEILGPVVQRDDPKVAQWRREVLQRDNHTCQFCGSTKNLHAHHILRWVDNPEARLIVANGITYCGTCHKTVPMGGGFVDSTPPKLTLKQSMFVQEYLIDLNATQAAIRAGYAAKRADAIAYDLLRKPEIATMIQEAMDKRAEKTGITAERVLEEIGKMAFANVQDLYDESGILRQIHELPRDVAAAVQSVKVNLTEACAVQEVKLWDKKGSLELLGKHLKLFTDKTELTGANGGAINITRVELVPLGDGAD